MFENMIIAQPGELPDPDERNPYEYFTKYLGQKKANQIPMAVMDGFMQYWEGNTFPWSTDHKDPWCVHWGFDDVVSALKDGEEIKTYHRIQDIDSDRPITGMFIYYGEFTGAIGLMKKLYNLITISAWDREAKSSYLSNLVESSQHDSECAYTLVAPTSMDIHLSEEFYLVAYGTSKT